MTTVTKEAEECRALFLQFLSHCKNRLALTECISEMRNAADKLEDELHKRETLLRAKEDPDLYQIID